MAFAILFEWFPTIALFVVVILLVQRLTRQKQSTSDNLPGPSGWPVLGFIPNFIAMIVFQGKPMQCVLDDLAKRYGPIYKITVAGKRVVVANNFETIKEILHHPDMNDRPHPGKPVVEMYKGTGVLYSSGDAWREQRKFSLSIFRGLGVGKRSFEDLITTEAGHLLEEIHAFSGTSFDPSDLITGAVSNVINSLTFGKRFEYSDPEFKQLQHLVDKRMENAGKEFLVMSIPFLLRLPFGPGHNVKSTIFEIRQRLTDIVEEHRASYDSENIGDFIDAYLGEILKDEGKESHFNYNNLVQTVEDLFLGGSQTTTTTLRWALLYLIAFPSVQNTIQRELDDTCGRNRLPVLSDKPNLPYLVATIHEIQRHACIFYILGVRATYVETTIGGYTIPPRTALLQNIWTVSKDPSIWKDPLEFRPERFLDEDNRVIKREEQLVFGAGRRSCMGENIAKTELTMFISHILHRFTLSKEDENVTLNLKAKPGGVLKPYPYKIKARER